jgi:hypothetical protein
LDKLQIKYPTYLKKKSDIVEKEKNEVWDALELIDQKNIEASKKLEETLEFNGPLEFKGSLTEDNKRYLVDALYITPKDTRFKSYYHK